MKIVHKEAGKFEQLYIMGGDAVFYFPSLLKPRKKYQSDEKQYDMTVFIDKETREKLEDHTDNGGLFVNKQFFEVGKDKNKKKKVKYPTSDQVKDDKATNYDDVKGLHGVHLTCPEFKKNGSKSNLKIIDAEGNPWPKDKLIGNGSKGNVRMWGYRNQDEQLVVTLDLVQVIEYVEYESDGSSGYDDVLGVNIPNEPVNEPVSEPEKGDNNNHDDFDDDIPF